MDPIHLRSIRRSFGALVTTALLCLPGPGSAQPANYPLRPIRIVLGQGAGGLADTTTRLVAQRLSASVGQPVVIDNKPGAGGIVAVQAVRSAPADGYTIMLGATANVISKSLLKSIPYDMEKDFVPISSVAHFDLVLLARHDAKFQSLDDIKRLAASKSGGINIGTTSPGSIQNLSAHVFASAAGIKATLVPFKSTSDIVVALVGGSVDLGFDTYSGVHGAIAGSQVRVIASTGPVRSAVQPSVATLREMGLERYEVTGWNALFAPVGTPAPIVKYLNEKIAAIVSTQEIQDKFRELGIAAKAGTPDDLKTLVRRDTERWAGVVKQFEIKPE